MILNGKIPKPWYVTGTFTYTDWGGNIHKLPTFTLVSLIFSIFSMLKSLVAFNIINIHISGVNDFSRFTRLILHITDLLAYFMSTALFRIWSIALFFSYLKEFGCIPILIFWVINVIYGYSKYVISFAIVILNLQNTLSSLFIGLFQIELLSG